MYDVPQVDYGALFSMAADAAPPGFWLQLGVYRGQTLERLVQLALKRDTLKPVYGADSFEGLPGEWDRGDEPHPRAAGYFACAPPKIEGAQLITGWFADTLPGFEWPGPCGLLHVDSDVYSSARDALEALEPRLRNGPAVIWDEWFGYPNCADHEQRACEEFCAKYGYSVEALASCPGRGSLLTRLHKLL